MKALTFPEFYGLNKEQKYDICHSLGFAEDCPFYELYELDSFYYSKTQQPFKPELIAELFEYFMFEDNYEDVDGYFYIYVSGHEIEVDADNATIYYGEYYICGIPRTINEFISDCQRTGIELKWRIK